MPTVQMSRCGIVGEADEKENLDLGQLWPGGGELSHGYRAVCWLHLSRRQHACRHQACTTVEITACMASSLPLITFCISFAAR